MRTPRVFQRDELADFIYTGRESEVQGMAPEDALEEMYSDVLDAVYWLDAPTDDEELERYDLAESVTLHNPTGLNMVLYGPEDSWSMIKESLDSTAADIGVEERSYPVEKDSSFVENMKMIDETVSEDSRIAIIGSDYCMKRIQKLASEYINAEESYVLGAQTEREGFELQASETVKTFFQTHDFEPWNFAR